MTCSGVVLMQAAAKQGSIVALEWGMEHGGSLGFSLLYCATDEG